MSNKLDHDLNACKLTLRPLKTRPRSRPILQWWKYSAK